MSNRSPCLKGPHKIKRNLNQLTRYGNLAIPIFAITGGIACGKSTVLNFFKQKGHLTLSADEIVKEIYREEQTIGFIEKILPDAIKYLADSTKSIDFSRLREAVFSQSSAQLIRNQLENFIHPKIQSYIQKHLLNLNDQTIDHLVYEIPLLFEKNYQENVDFIICVSSSEDNQIMRMSKNRKLSTEMAKKMIAAQMSLETKEQQSDFVIHNNFDDKILFNNLENFHSQYFSFLH